MSNEPLDKSRYIFTNWLEWLLIVLLFGSLSIIISIIISSFEEDSTFTIKAYFSSGALLFFCLGVVGNTLYTNWHGILSFRRFYGLLLGSIIPIGIAILSAFIFKELNFKDSLHDKGEYIGHQIVILLVTILNITIVKRRALREEFKEIEIQVTNRKNIEEQKEVLISFKDKLKKYILSEYSTVGAEKYKESLFELRDELDEVIKKI